MNEQTRTVVPWEDLPTEELAQTFSDYHKDVHGWRPRYVRPDDRSELLHQLNRLDEFMEYMKSSPQGKEVLKNEGWI